MAKSLYDVPPDGKMLPPFRLYRTDFDGKRLTPIADFNTEKEAKAFKCQSGWHYALFKNGERI
jgi:hypothetical protein